MSECDCIRCGCGFLSERLRGYCDDCVEAHNGIREKVAEKQNPYPGVHVDGKFAKSLECPESVFDEETMTAHCGLCGSEEIEQGYGLAGGYGCGSYRFCNECYAIMDFNEDTE
jgi:hypothetical protein